MPGTNTRARPQSAGEAFPPAYQRQFRRRLLDWYRRHARDLPWRRNCDPYAVWVSEIMLQQTQVATVIPYFQRFLAQLPTLASLAAADEQQVLKLWEGLGYYRRARQLHRAAQVICTQHGGAFPREPEIVRQLPGIGRYTAGAILSIAFDAREPILETNTLRLFARLLGMREDPHAKAGQQRLWHAAASVLPVRGTGELNQALMELGSQVCLPREPRCESCPVARVCTARELGLQDRIPLPKAKPAAEAVREVAVIVSRRDQILLLRRGADAVRWAGLWDFPRFAVCDPPADDHGRWLVEQLVIHAGVRARPGELLTTLKHTVTRFRITLDCYAATFRASLSQTSGQPETRWVLPGEMDDLPLSTTGRKLARLVQDM